ncbi:MAG: hypothetical protein GY754_31570 [bacterium]|nr:hypothetical protein [bacterium]
MKNFDNALIVCREKGMDFPASLIMDVAARLKKEKNRLYKKFTVYLL